MAEPRPPVPLAVVIPVLADVGPLTDLLAQISQQPQTPAEVIVVSGGAHEAVGELCKRFGARHFQERPCRGAQLDYGARQATAPSVWFLHADAQLPENAMTLIVDAIQGGATGGYFPFQFGGRSRLTKRLLAWCINARVRLGGVPYGDQGLFAGRDHYLDCGGFPHQPLFEEVALVRALRRRGPFPATAVPMVVSTRRWRRDGWVKRTLHNRWLALRYMLGADPEVLAGNYNGAVDGEPDNSAGVA